jgi:aryl-alcohol dehydrogenase-like predicted oxidoreductase
VEYRVLGRTGVRVSSLCLGSVAFGRVGEPDHEKSMHIIHAALDAGINFVDTADMYSGGESEIIVGKALRGRRDEVVLATKASSPMGPDPNRQGGSRRWLMQACEDSLRRLGTDRIDVYQVHRPDPDTDLDETLGALSDLIHQGKVLYTGTSTFPASMIAGAQWIAEHRGRERFACEQPPYSMVVRDAEADVLPTCQQHGLGVMTWSPLGGGWLSGRWRADTTRIESNRSSLRPERFDLTLPANRRKLAAVDRLAQLAEDAGLSLIHLAIAFVMSHPAVTCAIIGPRTMQHLESQLGAAGLRLPAAVLDRIDDIVPPGSNFGGPDAGWDPPSLTDPGQRRR